MSKILILFFGYILGSIPSGYLAGRWLADIDLREIGSGSTGATNVLRNVGKGPAVIVFLVDVVKGIGAVLLAKALNFGEAWEVAAGITALAGHIWSVWLRWQGGKAVATGLGVFLGLSWPVGLASLGIFLTILSFSRIVSLASIIASISLPLIMFLSFQEDRISIAYISVSLVAMIFVLWRHRSNLKRLLAGTEPQIGH